MPSDSQPKPFTQMSRFLIQKGIQRIVFTPKYVKKLKSGVLLDFTTSSILHLCQIWTYWQIYLWLGKVHSGLNQSKAILFDTDHDLIGIPEEDIKSELESQVFFKRFTKKRNDIIERYLQLSKWGCTRSKLICLYQTMDVASNVNPLVTTNNACRGCETCFKCCEGRHDVKSCPKVPMYKYCTCDHMSSSKQCPIWKKEKEILKVKTKRKIPYQRQKESSTYIIYRNQICHLMLQLWKLPRKILSPFLWTNQSIQVLVLTIAVHFRNPHVLLQIPWA